ncbi:hypothetical protein [Alkaliphilus peptidifermentans]|uniref:Uncharacterized protein n=1 Tax=Alkaliphilus peptidifermentans DSM 18978 TaxID=1120976 RepID=A0A1G5L0L8_9FIRM|nr:hypothetical protein [Alkaliphilus peptidifermentans]SCZ05971.1 hypothetical protein SAMN03080606_03917 [Alkaliphilus peptidifermentans DSM 18978]
MKHVIFSFWFMIIHTISYTLAGMFALKISKDIYDGKSRVLDYLKDMGNTKERKYVEIWFLPAQLLRGLILSFVLYPILGPLGELSFLIRLFFLAGLMFIYTHIGSAAPCPDNIEGFVYLKDKYFNITSFFKFQLEMIIYTGIFSTTCSFFLF